MGGTTSCLVFFCCLSLGCLEPSCLCFGVSLGHFWGLIFSSIEFISLYSLFTHLFYFIVRARYTRELYGKWHICRPPILEAYDVSSFVRGNPTLEMDKGERFCLPYKNTLSL